MKALEANELLNVWEHGLNQNQLQKNLSILIAACPAMSPDEIAKLSIGKRDFLLLQLREALFGSRLRNMSKCPGCAGRVEWESNVQDLYLQSAESSDMSDDSEMVHGDYLIRFRLPNSLDFVALSAENNEKSMYKALLLRCITECRFHGEQCGAENLSDDALKTLNDELEKKDPQANINITLNCPVCSYHWDAVFDIGSYLWHEINNWAENMFQTIHLLAGRYGWSETEILNMSPSRRRIYVSMIDL